MHEVSSRLRNFTYLVWKLFWGLCAFSLELLNLSLQVIRYFQENLRALFSLVITKISSTQNDSLSRFKLS